LRISRDWVHIFPQFLVLQALPTPIECPPSFCAAPLTRSSSVHTLPPTPHRVWGITHPILVRIVRFFLDVTLRDEPYQTI
ncbi:hypothetical protein EDC04DRAFT_2711031, partial [Pisolithus marmoratus]